jgi:hypothetical protein
VDKKTLTNCDREEERAHLLEVARVRIVPQRTRRRGDLQQDVRHDVLMYLRLIRDKS